MVRPSPTFRTFLSSCTTDTDAESPLLLKETVPVIWSVELVAAAVTVTVASPSPDIGLTDIPVPDAEAVQELLALTWMFWAPPSEEKARLCGETVRTGSGVGVGCGSGSGSSPHAPSTSIIEQKRNGRSFFITRLINVYDP